MRVKAKNNSQIKIRNFKRGKFYKKYSKSPFSSNFYAEFCSMYQLSNTMKELDETPTNTINNIISGTTKIVEATIQHFDDSKIYAIENMSNAIKTMNHW